MGAILLRDFGKQKKNLTAILLVAIPAAAVGYGFQSIYSCLGFVFTAGLSIIYLNSFFDFLLSIKSNHDDDKITKLLKEKVEVRTKYVEILILTFSTYIISYLAYIAHAFDKKMFSEPDFVILEQLEQIMLFPILLLFLLSIFTPLLVKLKIGKAGFISLAVISILATYGVLLLDHFTSFTLNKSIMMPLSFSVLGFALISYFISMSITIRKY